MMTENYNPYSQMLTAFDNQRIFGRDEEISAVLRSVTGNIASTIGLYGLKTIGKTSLLKLLCHPETLEQYKSTIRASGRRGHGGPTDFDFVYIDLYHVSGADVVPTIYEVLKLYVAPQPTMSEQNEEAVRRELTRICQETAYEKRRIIICLDHFDRAFKDMPDQDDKTLRHLTNFHSFVVATEKRLEDLRPRSLFMNVTTSKIIGLISHEDAHTLILSPLQPNQSERFNADDAEEIVRMAGRQPYLLTVACEFLFGMKPRFPDGLKKLQAEQSESYKRLAIDMTGMVDVDTTLTHFWNELTPRSQTILSEIARSGKKRYGLKDYNRPDLFLSVELAVLKNFALVVEDLLTQTYELFSQQFWLHILRHTISDTSKLNENQEQLTRLERAVLSFLQERSNQVCGYSEVIASVWPQGNGSSRALQSAIYRIQAKLEESKIENVYGQGYRYVSDKTA